MCIIVAKPRGAKLPSEEIIRNCFSNNPDGAGLMYVKDNQVIVDKGYMTIDTLLERIESLKSELKSETLENDSVVLHFRIGTQGKNDKETTHPFIISDKDERLRALKIVSNVGMAHNGIISSYTKYGEVLSDTQLFIKHFIHPMYHYNKRFYNDDKLMEMIHKVAGGKICFLDNNGDIHWLGEKIEKDGCFYSNSTYSYSYERASYTPVYPIIVNKRGEEEEDSSEFTYDGFSLDWAINHLTPIEKGDWVCYSEYDYFIVEEDGEYYMDKKGHLYTTYYDYNEDVEIVQLINDFVEVFDGKTNDYKEIYI